LAGLLKLAFLVSSTLLGSPTQLPPGRTGHLSRMESLVLLDSIIMLGSANEAISGARPTTSIAGSITLTFDSRMMLVIPYPSFQPDQAIKQSSNQSKQYNNQTIKRIKQ
jgi:hypothetical protein